MEKEFCTYEQSLALKDLGFDEPCFRRYMPNGIIGDYEVESQPIHKLACTAPLIQQAFRFFRDKYGLVGLIEIGTHEFSYLVFNIKEDKRITIKPEFNGTYPEAEQACLYKLIELATAQRKQEQYIALTDLMKADEADGLYDLDI